MTRSLALSAAFLLTAGLAAGQDPKRPADPTNPVKASTVELYGQNNNIDISGGAPSTRVITNQKDWEMLAKTWGIPTPAKIDFTKEFLVVVTSTAEKVTIETKLGDKGDLKVNRLEGGMTRGGFSWGVKSVRRDGVKTVDGRPLATE